MKAPLGMIAHYYPVDYSDRSDSVCGKTTNTNIGSPVLGIGPIEYNWQYYRYNVQCHNVGINKS